MSLIDLFTTTDVKIKTRVILGFPEEEEEEKDREKERGEKGKIPYDATY